MSAKLRDSFRGRGPVPKILLAGAALSAVGLIGAGAANAAGAFTTAGHPVTSGSTHTVVVKTAKATTAEPTTGKDTDNVQAGDQTSPEKPGTSDTKDSTETKDSSEPTGEDTDNIQSGDQSGDQSGLETPDTGQNR